MKKTILLLTILSLFFITGCSKEGMYKGMYKGLQQAEQMESPSDEPFPDEQPSYEEYKHERDKELSNK